MAEVEWQGRTYPVPDIEPPQLRGLELCHPYFASAAEAWVKAANDWLNRDLLPNGERSRYLVYPGETRRNLERQCFLYAISRVILLDKTAKSWTLDSRHRWGLAVDMLCKDQLEGELVWDPEWWEELLNAVPPRYFGLTDIRPKELVHLELVEADAMIARAGEFGLVQS